MNRYLSIDLGGSKIMMGVIDGSGNIISELRHECDHPYTENEILSSLKEMKEHILLDFVKAGGCTVPGLCDSKNGIFISGPYFPIKNWKITADLEALFGIPFAVENDVNACAVAEKTLGTMKDETDFMWLTLSNGVGGALYLNNALYTGKNFGAGEIGHTFTGNARRCDCGNLGCLETVASGRGIVKTYKSITGKSLDAKEIAALAKNGDAIATEAFIEAGSALGRVISYTANLLNIDSFVFGGGVSESLDIFKEAIIEEASKHLLKSANPKINIIYTAFGYNAAFIGAMAIAKNHFEGKK